MKENKVQRKNNTQNGITLIALIITIIVLLILAISIVQRDDIIRYVTIAKNRYDGAQENESQTLQDYESYIDSSIKKDYTPLEYLQSNGTQYIDTRFLVNINNCSKIRLVVDTQITSTSGWRLDGSAKVAFNGIYIGIGPNGTIYYGVGNDTSTGIKYNQNRYVYDLDVKNKKYIVTNKETGENIVNLENITTKLDYFDEAGLHLWLFGYDGEKRRHNALIYGCQIYDDDKLVRDFIPVLDREGIPCLYDKIEGKFYYNQGNGENFDY